MPYQNTLFVANSESLKTVESNSASPFSRKILSTNSCLHTLLPPERNNEVLCKLRKPLKHPVPYSRTKRYQSFLNYALAHFQNSKWISVFYSFLFMLSTVYILLCNAYFISRVLYCTICMCCSFYVVYAYQSSFLAATIIINVCLVLSCHHLALGRVELYVTSGAQRLHYRRQNVFFATDIACWNRNDVGGGQSRVMTSSEVSLACQICKREQSWQRASQSILRAETASVITESMSQSINRSLSLLLF